MFFDRENEILKENIILEKLKEKEIKRENSISKKKKGQKEEQKIKNESQMMKIYSSYKNDLKKIKFLKEEEEENIKDENEIVEFDSFQNESYNLPPLNF